MKTYQIIQDVDKAFVTYKAASGDDDAPDILIKLSRKMITELALDVVSER